ncbi:DUF2637 domain-containing protein [Micromonospora krabiensis]|uniref:DUF2637 domain-containing protein n=1 Tax=Micromonospora krabiensis TaxID=307121 RepID=A0A1C3N6U6_9ACTN|nr:DUF2637 domain-containing protein [Micromonospora krabiensis]SBV28290.1 Protein of unknown function [Micromonospora krabiensis]
MTATPLPQHTSARTPRIAEVDTRHLTRLRWAVRAVLALGVAASIAANVLHARPNLISQVIAAWPPLALLLTVELISRVPADRRGLAAARLIAAAGIAGIAAWVSYWHMVGVAARYGETDAAASYLLPISVDGLVVVASISLVEIAGRIRTPSLSPADGQQPAAMPAETQSPIAESPNQEAPVPASGPIRAAQLAQDCDVSPMPRQDAAISADEGDLPATDFPAPAPAGESGIEEVAPEPPLVVARDQEGAHLDRAGDEASAARETTQLRAMDPCRLDGNRPGAGRSRTSDSLVTPLGNSAERDRVSLLADEGNAERASVQDQGHDLDPDDGRRSAKVPPDTAGAVAYWYRQDPSLHPADIAARIGRSERTVRRYWPPVPRTANRRGTSRAAEQVGAS